MVTRSSATCIALRLLGALTLLQLGLLTGGCGGGGQQQSLPPPPPAEPDFTLSTNPTMVTVFQGSGTPVSVSTTTVNGFSSQISVQLSGLPPGVTASPASFSITPGTPQTVVLFAAASAAASTSTVTFTGVSGSLSHAASVTVSVSALATSTLPSRTRYIRSDAVTEYGYWLNRNWEVFHSPTSRFFVTDPFSNQMFVYDSATEREIGTISVPGAYGIDETPDQSTLYVGTLTGDVYTIDPIGLKVTHRYLASQIGPNGYASSVALPLSNGSVALLGEAGGIPSVDGSPSFAIWNPSSNSIVVYASSYGAEQLYGQSVTVVCGSLQNIFEFALTADRSSVLVGGLALCEVNAATGQDNYIPNGGNGDFVVSPDGKYIAVASPAYPGGEITLYDAHTLNKVSQFSVAVVANSSAGIAFSADSQTLFVSNESTVYAYNVASGQQSGWLSNIIVSRSSGGMAVGPTDNPNYEFSDDTGLLVGPMEEGVGFLDTTMMNTGPVASSLGVAAFASPATGVASGGTQVQWPAGGSGNPTVYFGGNQAPSASLSSGVTLNATATTPAGNPGPVPIYMFTPDGGMQLLADGFSYGPTILEVAPNASTADGGSSGVIYGYGFGPTTSNAIPSSLSVSVGGMPATITGFNPNAYNVEPYPFQLEAIYYTIPPSAAGSSADVAVVSSSGGTVATNAMLYLPAVQKFSLPGSQLAQGIYDAGRDVYYFTDVNRIQVFSRTQGQWLSPISVPAPNGAKQRLWGIALSPDGSKLAVADSQANVIYIVNPADTSSVQTIAFAPSEPPGVIAHPVGVAISDAGEVYITSWVEGGSGFNTFFELDTNTGILTSYFQGGANSPQDIYSRTEIRSDSSRVFFNADGYVFYVNTATNTASTPIVGLFRDYDLGLSSDQTRVEASSYLYDSALNSESFETVNDREVKDVLYVYGVKLSPDGRLLFQPSTNGIDVYDGRLGTLLKRIALPFALSQNYDALVADGKDNVLIAITGQNSDGIAVVDLTSLSEPAPLPYTHISSPEATATHPSESARTGSEPRPPKKNGRWSGVRVIPHVTHFAARRSGQR